MKTTNPLFAKIRLFLIVLTSCVIATCIFLDYYSSGSMDDAGMWNHNRIVHFAVSGIWHTQEPEENLNKCCFFSSSATVTSSLYHSSPNLRIKGSFRNLYTGDSLFSQQNRCFAYIPTMIIHRFIRSVISNPDRIKMTGYRFIEVCFPSR